MAANPEKRRYSFEQYITLLRNNDQRLEYDHGEIYAMAGSSANHAAISANMWRALDDALGEDATDAFFLDSPSIVVEVLSKSTEARDRTYKLLRYQAKQSIQEIVLISQYVQHVEVITRTTSGWEYQEYGHEERFTLASLNATIRVSEIYRRLSIPIEKRTFMPLEIIEPADEQEDS